MTTTPAEPEEQKDKSLLDEAVRQGAIPDGFNPVELEWAELKKPGDWIMGILLDRQTIHISGNPVCRYIIDRLPSHTRTGFLGSMQLDTQLREVRISQQIFVKFIGTETAKKSGFPMKVYQVGVK